MTKYNKSEIMRNAWAIKRSANVNMSTALKAAWVRAKAIAAAENYIANECNYCGHQKVNVSDWANYGKNRTYINVRCYTNAWNLKREVKFGYVDNLSGQYVA